MSLSHQSTFNSPPAGPTYYGTPYYGHYAYAQCDQLDFTHQQTATRVPQQGPYSTFPTAAAAASYGMLSALHHGGGPVSAGVPPAVGPCWYDPAGGVDPLDVGLSRFDVACTGSTPTFRRLLPVGAPTLDVKPETEMESVTGRSDCRTACRELNADADVSSVYNIFAIVLFFSARCNIYISRLLYATMSVSVCLSVCL